MSDPNLWRREERIMGFCANHAHQIIAELRTSDGDHQDDIDVLEELIESWDLLRVIAEEERLHEEHRAREAS
jgi:hypothetical protein